MVVFVNVWIYENITDAVYASLQDKTQTLENSNLF